jgi:hypothetical protein
MKKIFVLVWVHRGLIQVPEIFYNRKDAEFRKEIIQRKCFNPDYDEIDVFVKAV